ncbi:MAG: outer membrane beta-barrel protein [Lutibacter sp.]|nr:outer membrane beta-barrel protein [Lutibacter sp.]
MKKLVLLITFICVTITSKAQINELGFFVGGSNYIGDIGPENYINPNRIMGGIIYKWNMNPRIAIRGTFTYAQISANDIDATNIARNIRGIEFNNSIKEIAVGFEFNYFEYNLNNYRNTYTPYLIFEIAAFNYKVVESETPVGSKQYQYSSKTSFAIPFGIGFKTKLYRDFALAIEIRARYTFEDDIDYNNPEIDSLTFGNPNSSDWYMLSGISLVYTFGRPACYSTPY